MKPIAAVLVILGAGWATAQQTSTPASAANPSGATLNAKDSEQLARRITQLMESTAVMVPGLTRSTGAIAESARQAVLGLQTTPQNSGLTYSLLGGARAYLAVADALPKPVSLPETARQQFAELRDAVERFGIYFESLLDEKERQLRNPDRDNLRRYADANEKLGAPSPAMPRVVFFGDSITDSWRLNEYFTGREYVNRGISGQVTGEMLGRMKADVLDLHPRAVLILAGTNDVARGVPVKTIESNLEMIGELANAQHIRPLFASILPVSDYHKDANPRFEMTRTRPPATILQINNWLQNYCRQHNYSYVDYYSALKDNAGMLMPDASDDGLHPNGKGYRIMAPVAMEALNRVVPGGMVTTQTRPAAQHAVPAPVVTPVVTNTAAPPAPAATTVPVAKPVEIAVTPTPTAPVSAPSTTTSQTTTQADKPAPSVAKPAPVTTTTQSTTPLAPPSTSNPSTAAPSRPLTQPSVSSYTLAEQQQRDQKKKKKNTLF